MYRVLKGIFCPSLGAEFRPHSQSKIATFFPNIMSDFPNTEFFFFFFFFFFTFLETTSSYEKQ